MLLPVLLDFFGVQMVLVLIIFGLGLQMQMKEPAKETPKARAAVVVIGLLWVVCVFVG